MRSARSRGRRFAEDEHPLRTRYQRDRDRVIQCSSFRRLEYKTQVFVNHEGDNYRTRLTHSLEAAQVGRTVARALGLNEELTESHRQADKLFFDLQEQILKVRMVPLGPLFRRYIRVVRDLAANGGKQARLVIEDADVEVDNSVMAHLQDPLTHMVRNALDHGIETPDARRTRGKDSCGS